jgi:hypothetical protein
MAHAPSPAEPGQLDDLYIRLAPLPEKGDVNTQ